MELLSESNWTYTNASFESVKPVELVGLVEPVSLVESVEPVESVSLVDSVEPVDLVDHVKIDLNNLSDLNNSQINLNRFPNLKQLYVNCNNRIYSDMMHMNWMNNTNIILNESIQEISLSNCTLKIFSTDLNCLNKLNKLEISYCNFVKDDDFLNLPDNLNELRCCLNSIVNLNNLPNKLKKLVCNANKIEHIDNLPAGLLILECSGNKLKTLDLLPESLVELNCSRNSITSLQNLPINLERLNCSYNNLIELNYLPNNLKILICSYNNITSINLPETIEKIDARYNQLETIPKTKKYLCLQNYSLKKDSKYIDKIANIKNKIVWHSKKGIGYGYAFIIGVGIVSISPLMIPLLIYVHCEYEKKTVEIKL